MLSPLRARDGQDSQSKDKTHPSPHASSSARARSWTRVQSTVMTPLEVVVGWGGVCAIFGWAAKAMLGKRTSGQKAALMAQGGTPYTEPPGCCGDALPPPPLPYSRVCQRLQRDKRQPDGAGEAAAGRLGGRGELRARTRERGSGVKREDRGSRVEFFGNVSCKRPVLRRHCTPNGITIRRYRLPRAHTYTHKRIARTLSAAAAQAPIAPETQKLAAVGRHISSMPPAKASSSARLMPWPPPLPLLPAAAETTPAMPNARHQSPPPPSPSWSWPLFFLPFLLLLLLLLLAAASAVPGVIKHAPSDSTSSSRSEAAAPRRAPSWSPPLPPSPPLPSPCLSRGRGGGGGGGGGGGAVSRLLLWLLLLLLRPAVVQQRSKEEGAATIPRQRRSSSAADAPARGAACALQSGSTDGLVPARVTLCVRCSIVLLHMCRLQDAEQRSLCRQRS